MFKERSTRVRLGGSGLGGRGGRRRAVRAARPRGNNPKPFNAIRWLQFVVIGIGIFKSSVLVAAGSGNCFGAVNYFYPIEGQVDGEGVKLKGKDDSDFKQVVKGSASFDKTWIGYKTSVEYMGKANLTALSFEFVSSF
ncbi:hypothetical protein M3Y95_00270700 [Aphelenchoides besseyi]|nr:hypothetical protein M3Y95_00270700 [Aphelenchoides besseyi]